MPSWNRQTSDEKKKSEGSRRTLRDLLARVAQSP